MAPRRTQRKKRSTRRTTSRGKKLLLAVLAIALVTLAATGVVHYRRPLESEGMLGNLRLSGVPFIETPPSGRAGQSFAEDYRVARVVRVLDGATLIIESAGLEERVCLAGIEIPSTRNFPNADTARWAATRARDHLEARLPGTQVRLKTDSVMPADQVGRRMVHVELDGQSVNEELLRLGYGRLPTDSETGFARQRELRRAETEARDAKRGIWGTPPAIL